MMRLFGLLVLLASSLSASSLAAQRAPASDKFVTTSEAGRPGGQLVVVQRTEPRTLNPITAVDSPSRDVLRRTTADLIHVNRETQQLEPALAKSWTVSPDGRRFTLAVAARRAVLRWRPVRRRRCAVLVPGLPGREGRVATTRHPHRRRQADRGHEARSVHGASRRGGAVFQRRAAVRQRRDAAAPSARAAVQGGPARRSVGCARRPPRSPGWGRFVSRSMCPASGSSSSATRTTGRRTAPASSCRISTGSCSCSCRAKTRRRCGSRPARPTSRRD